MQMQYLSYWLDGDGHEHLMDPDLPLANATFTRERNGIGRLSASLPPEYGRQTAFNNRPVIQEWATAIYVEIDGDMFDGFLVAETADDNEKLVIDGIGFLGYAEDQPWSDRANPYNEGNVYASRVIETIWDEVQRLRGANLGLQYDLRGGWPYIGNPNEDDMPTPHRPGPKPEPQAGKQPKAPKYPTGPSLSPKEVYERLRRIYEEDMKTWREQKKEDAQALREYEGRLREYEDAWKERDRMTDDAKIKLNYWSTHSLLSSFQSLQREIGFSYRVDHRRHGNEVIHLLRCRHETLGQRRHEIAFTEGENVYSVPRVTQKGGDKVTSAVILGSGDGSSTLWRQTSLPAGGGAGLRRARVFADKSLTRSAQLAARANEVLDTHEDPIDVDQFKVIDHGLAPIRSFDVGDEVLLRTFARRGGNIERWVVVEEITLEPEDNSVMVRVAPIPADYPEPEWVPRPHQPRPWDLY